MGRKMSIRRFSGKETLQIGQALFRAGCGTMSLVTLSSPRTSTSRVRASTCPRLCLTSIAWPSLKSTQPASIKMVGMGHDSRHFHIAVKHYPMCLVTYVNGLNTHKQDTLCL